MDKCSKNGKHELNPNTKICIHCGFNYALVLDSLNKEKGGSNGK